MDTRWPKVLDIISDQISSTNYKGWFAPTKAELIGGELIVYVPNNFVKETLSIKFLPILQPAISQHFGSNTNFIIKVDPGKCGKPPKTEDEIELDFTTPAPRNVASGLNPKYTLSNFVVGFSNNLAYAAAQAIVKNPGLSYNPLFIYGGTGVGKTHLMQGIGHAMLQNNPRLKVIYCSSEKFMNDFVQGIQTKKMGDFRAKYRNSDLLLIDDIQFISGRDAIQEEFFHTFNELQGRNTQIVLTSDRPPHEIQKLEARLASRFQGGLMVDIQQPDFDTRVAILKAKCEEQREEVSDSILTLIAESMVTNARELEGKLLQIVQTAKLLNQPVTEDYVRQILGQSINIPSAQKLDPKKVIIEVNRYFNIKTVDLVGPRRKKELVLPRQIIMYLLYQECKLPYQRIGEILGGRDHTTIMHGVEKIHEASARDREIQRMIIEIKQVLVG